MTILTLRSIRKDFGIQEILKEANFSLDEGEKVGLIGTNGSGKSTLLKMMAGLEPIDGGDRWVNSGAKIVYLPQQPEMDPEHTVLEQVFADCGPQMDLIRQYEAVSHELSHSPENHDRLLAQLASLSQQIEAAGAWDVETQAKVVLSKLGIEDFEAKVGTLSGGYRKRIAIATALLSDPDALLMDEPTNHLDALSVEWLQSYLKRFRGALLLITHDRYFLDQVTQRIIEIDRGALFTYGGNYSYYLTKKADMEESEASSQRKHAGVLRREMEWLKRGPKARSTKQKARIDRIQDMQNQEFRQGLGTVDITTAGRRIGKKVVELEGVCKGYGDPTTSPSEYRLLIKDFTYLFNPDDRVGIIGPNGVGKSTLMDLITGRLEPDQGRIEQGSTIHIGYFDQHSDPLQGRENQRVIDYLKDVAELVTTADGSVITASQMLERFLFSPNKQYAPIHKLSGGEKRRLFLLQVLMEAPNLLILDEPTNDLDVQTLGVLEDYLEGFNGCVIVVSHDRYFLDRTVNTLFAFEPGGTLRQFTGNYSLYLEQQKELEAQENQATGSQSKANGNALKTQDDRKSSSKDSQRLSYKEKREYEQLEQQIPRWESEKAALEDRIYNHPPQDFTELQTLTEKLNHLTDTIDEGTMRWLELAERG